MTKEITKQLKSINNELKEFRRRLDANDKRFDAHDRRFDAHDKRFDAHDKEFQVIKAEQANQTRILKILQESAIRSEISNRKTEIHLEKLNKEFREALYPSQMLSEHSLKIKDHEERIETVETDTKAIKTAIKDFNPR